VLFSSYEYIFLFLPITFFAYFGLNRLGLEIIGKVWLVAASLFFYAWFNIYYLPILLGTVIVNFGFGIALSKANWRSSTRKLVLILGIVFNIALLGYFKYADFLIKNYNALTGSSVPLLHILLPLALSFVTFQMIAFLVDSYNHKVKEYSPLTFTLFASFFPQQIAGPIVHHSEMMPQFASRQNLRLNYDNIALGLFIFSLGLFKKVMIADTFAIWADSGFGHAGEFGFHQAWVTSLSYTFQLYFDFSGYTDMAIGSALLFNIRLPINFNSPYKALDIQDFWRRWHITLSRFLRDYIYIPFGGNRNGELRTYANLFATFLIGGLWHGASWMFVIWGALHGTALIIHRVWSKTGFRLPGPLAWLLTFNFVNIAWVFFRAPDLDTAERLLYGMVKFTGAFSSDLSILPTASLAALGFMADYFAEYLGTSGVIYAVQITAILCSFVLISLKNTSQIYLEARPLSWCRVFLGGTAAGTAAIASLTSTSAVFLYFNF